MSAHQRTRADILPIDHGWAWIIVLAGNGLFGLVAGSFKSQGIILIELIERYPNLKPSSLLWVFTVNYVVSAMIGPITSWLSLKFTHRHVILAGVALIASGYMGLAYSSSLVTMILLHSIPTGIGNGLVILTALLVTAPYFQKRKALALGIVASGSGVSTFILPYILRALFDSMGFTNGMVLYVGFILQYFCLASLLRPMSFYEHIYSSKLKKLEQNTASSSVLPGISSPLDNDKTEQRELNSLLDTVSLHNRSVNHLNRQTSQQKSYFSSAPHMQECNKTDCHLSPMPKPDIRIISVGDLSGSIHFTESMEQIDSTNPSPQASTKETFDWRIVYKPIMIMFLSSLCLYCMVIYQALPAMAKEAGMSKETVAILMAAAGAVEIPSRTGNGLLADRHIMTAYTQYTVSLLIAGCAALTCAIISGLAGVIVALVGMSMCGTSIFSLIPIVLSELIGPNNITSAMGIQVVFQGLGMVTTTFITGTLYNLVESWRLVLYYIASCMLVGGATLVPYCVYQIRLKSKTQATK